MGGRRQGEAGSAIEQGAQCGALVRLDFIVGQKLPSSEGLLGAGVSISKMLHSHIWQVSAVTVTPCLKDLSLALLLCPRGIDWLPLEQVILREQCLL